MSNYDIVSNTCITYRDLINRVLDWLVQYTENIPTVSANVPDVMKKEGTVINKFKYVEGVLEGHNPTLKTDGGGGINIVIKEGFRVEAVTLETARTELINFLKSKNLYAREDTPVSTTQIVSFYNNIAAFLAIKLCHCSSSFTTATPLVYVSDTWAAKTNALEQINRKVAAIPTVTVLPGDEYLEDDTIENATNELIAQLNNISNLRAVQYDFNLYSSCSSSCSSSSSSSSSSSCSSIFIGYMRLT